jgi:hypothetical protein
LGLLASILGRGSAGPQVVHRRPLLVRAALRLATLLIALFGLYVVYELGRYNAGYDRQAAAEQRTVLEVQIEHLEKANREMHTRLAEADTVRLGRAREQAEVARTIGDLQAQVARQSQELAFYRGVVAQGAASLGLRIEDLRITAGKPDGVFNVHMALVRSGRAEALASGSIALSVDGEYQGGEKTLDLATLTAGRQRDLRYDFRYFQDYDEELTLPAGFKPEHLVVEVRSTRHDVAPLSQTFLWSVEPSP